ncbi:hypothetical protein SAMN05216351_10438 [Pseudobutyrivibrio sp. JW11]|uniref:hypothetical protein n=1 Tax=Pseudobutyrivibrio sp. JW11 TaxID=1855302 RepID=UPI0008E79614|nr:hypothetical protein [Pseudobutyrivibrio sp. JW11]SFO17470.1 hypothetical protein SAMN05216351_10438 [Pseudobutyrivibrio sp. JW11]
MKSVSNREILYKYCEIMAKCYSTGNFTEIYPFLSDDCVWESQWRLTPEEGKDAVVRYFTNKGRILQESKSFPQTLIVEFVDNINLMDEAAMKTKEGIQHGKLGLVYETGKIALFMAQELNDVTNGMILDFTLNDDNLIKRIDICMPELFKFKKYDASEIIRF